jgi:hypothetical protein
MSSRVMQWIVLCGIPYSGSGALASPEPSNLFHYFGFPLPSIGAGPTGHREAFLLISQHLESTTRCFLKQAVQTLKAPASLQLFENSKGLILKQVHSLWNLWENAKIRHSLSRDTQPSMAGKDAEIREPVDEQLHGERHQQQPHDADKNADSGFAHHHADAPCRSQHPVADQRCDQN